MSDNVISAFGVSCVKNDARAKLIQNFAETLDALIADGVTPTGSVFVLLDDEGASRTGWSFGASRFPSNAGLGLALNALIQAMSVK